MSFLEDPSSCGAVRIGPSSCGAGGMSPSSGGAGQKGPYLVEVEEVLIPDEDKEVLHMAKK